MTLKQQKIILVIALMVFTLVPSLAIIVGCSGHLMVESKPDQSDVAKKSSEHRNEDTYNLQFQARIANTLDRIEVQLRRIANKP
jgi:hypothetical protein